MKLTKKQLMGCIIGFIAVNAIIIIGILVFASSRAGTMPKSENDLLVNTPETSEAAEDEPDKEEVDVVYESEESPEEGSDLFKKDEPVLSEAENYQVIYKALIPGTYETEEGMVFTFNMDGTFDGYFNSDNPHVTHYNYDIVGEVGVESFIKISNPTFSESESYRLEFTSDGKILMYYSEDKYIELGI